MLNNQRVSYDEDPMSERLFKDSAESVSSVEHLTEFIDP